MTAPSTPDHRPASAARRDRFIARRLIPGGILITGIVLLAIGGGLAPLGVGLLFAAFLVFVADLLARLMLSSQDDRDEEARAREIYRRTGQWPGGGG